jgi:mRNA interferase MazF
MTSMSIPRTPKRGEKWLVNFDPAVGAEIRKIRPSVVMSVDRIARLPLRVVVPLTDWKTQYVYYPWFVQICATATNGLSKDTGADAFQFKSVSEDRFRRFLGNADASEIDAIAAALGLVVGKP